MDATATPWNSTAWVDTARDLLFVLQFQYLDPVADEVPALLERGVRRKALAPDRSPLTRWVCVPLYYAPDYVTFDLQTRHTVVCQDRPEGVG